MATMQLTNQEYFEMLANADGADLKRAEAEGRVELVTSRMRSIGYGSNSTPSRGTYSNVTGNYSTIVRAPESPDVVGSASAIRDARARDNRIYSPGTVWAWRLFVNGRRIVKADSDALMSLIWTGKPFSVSVRVDA